MKNIYSKEQLKQLNQLMLYTVNDYVKLYRFAIVINCEAIY